MRPGTEEVLFAEAKHVYVQTGVNCVILLPAEQTAIEKSHYK